MLTKMTITIASLGDLTGNPAHQNRPLPQIWVDALKAVFPEMEKQTMLPPFKAGKLSALIPHTTLVLCVKPFVWATIQALVGFWLLWGAQKSGSQAEGAAAGINIIDGIKDMLASLVKLDEDKGEMCTYSALIVSGDPIKTAIGMFPQMSDLIAAHHNQRKHCPVTTCRYHGAACEIKENELLALIDSLIDKRVFKSHGGQTLWVTL